MGILSLGPSIHKLINPFSFKVFLLLYIIVSMAFCLCLFIPFLLLFTLMLCKCDIKTFLGGFTFQNVTFFPLQLHQLITKSFLWITVSVCPWPLFFSISAKKSDLKSLKHSNIDHPPPFLIIHSHIPPFI